MSKNKRLFTFLIATSDTSKVRRLSIHHNILYAISGVLLAALLAAALGTFRLAQHEALNFKYESIKAQNEDLKKENDAFQNSYAKLKGQIAYIGDMSNELARQAKMETVSEVDQQVGTGGPETVAALDKAADNLERQVRHIGDQLNADILRLASIPSGLPVNGYLTDGFGIRHNPFGGEGREFHNGIDVAVEFGTSVSTTADGLVVWAAPFAGYGNLVVVYHSNGITTRYGHLSKITVESGQRVKRGDQIGHAGSTGRSTGPHVHYEIRQNDQPIDALQYVGQPRP
jgi:murein DD-endopeptidase MepM/ murein hydrolase activator NlpD